MPYGYNIRAMLSWTMTKLMVFHMKISDFPLLMSRFPQRLTIGMNAPLIQRICNIPALSIHLSVMAMVISSGATSESPNMAGKETKQVKRIIFRNTRS